MSNLIFSQLCWNGMMGDHMGWGMGFFGWVWSLVILAVVVLVVWALIKYISSGGVPKKSPLDTLNERYARGEISREEYQEKKKDIGG